VVCSLSSILLYLLRRVYGTFVPCSSSFRDVRRKKIGLPMKGGRFSLQNICSLLVEKEPDTGAQQLLTHIAIIIGFDLGAGIIEIFILDKGTHVLREKVI
jgi:hypothetical protein